jgi:hypothetical protein
MLESRREIIDRMLAFMGEKADTEARTIAEQLLDAELLTIWLRHPFRSFLMPDPYQLATVAGTRSYILPQYFGRVASKDRRLTNLTTGGLILPVEGDSLYLTHPEAGSAVDTTTGEPSNYLIAGVCGVNVQVAAAGENLEVVSDSVLDVDVHAVVEGIDGTGVYTMVDHVLNGVTPVNFGTWKSVQNFSKSWPTTVTAPTSQDSLTGATPYTSSRGNITLRTVAGASARQSLLPHESLREQWTITFWRTPQAAQTIAIPILRQLRRLIYDADPVPSMWGPALFEGMRLQWAVNTGNLPAASLGQVSRPCLIDLMCWDNELRSGGSSYTVPFGMR